MKDRYQILSTLASGGSGSVQQAWDTSMNRDVAIKRLNKDATGLDALLREARALYALRHPNIVTIHEYDSDEQGAYLVMELIKGESLEQRLSHGPLDMPDFKALVKQTLEAIGTAHEAGLIHRDLKPENIMLPWNREGHFQVKLIDFGLAQQGGIQRSMTGSIHYMAPEQFGSGHVDARTDLYALGCIYYQALSGQLPFPGEEKAQVITAHLYPPRVKLADLRPDLRDELCTWVEWLMQVLPAARPASAAEALLHFQNLGENLHVQTATGVPESAPIFLDEEELPAVLIDDEPEPVLAIAAEQTQPFSVASAIPDPEPVIAKRRAVSGHPHPAPKRRSNLALIVTVFLLIVVAQLALVSYFKYAGREEREQRLTELSTDDSPQGSDVDVRLLLDFLPDPTHREQATQALIRLQGGDYIDTLLQEHLEKVRSYPVCVPLIQIIGQRRSTAAFDILLGLITDTRGDVRKAAWTALGRISPAEKLPRLLTLVHQSHKLDREVIEKALVTLIESSQDRPQATEATLQAYRAATAHPESRAILFNVLTRVGGDDILNVVIEAISDPSSKLRLAAITTLANYPTHDPLAAISTRFPEEPDETCRIYLLLAARELIGNPGPHSQQTLFLHAQSLYSNARDTVEKRYVLSVLSRIIAPGTATFFEDFSKSADADLKAEATDLAQAFRDKLMQVIHIPTQGAATLPADKADYRLEAALTLDQGALIHWQEEGDWASWLVELPRNGDYEIALYQAHAGEQLGTYEILLAGQTLLTSVVQTQSPTDFKGFVIGSIQVQQPGIYRLRVRAKTIPPGSDLFRVQKLVVKAQ